MTGRIAVCALCGALWVAAAADRVHAARALAAAPPAFFGGDCVATLRNVRAGTGAKAFASAYVFSNGYAYGEWAAGVAHGQSLWRKRGSAWCKVQTGAVTLDERALAVYGVPVPVARRLIAEMASGSQIAPPESSKDVRHR
jgi:hypothetical protein